MDLGLRGKVALVAASSKGLGRAVAQELASEGSDVVICARNPETLEGARKAITATTSARVLAVPTDLSEPDSVASLIAASKDSFGRIDILVTNAGGPPAGLFDSHSPEAWDEAVRQNLHSVVNLTRLVLPGMKERGWGRIINITSIAAKQPVDSLILSNSMRAAVTGFAKTLANEVARFNVTVNNVLPGYTRTERVEALAQAIAKEQGTTPEEAVGVWERQIPMGRIGTPEEFAAVVTFLASKRASYVTGVSIPVDGGWIRGL